RWQLACQWFDGMTLSGSWMITTLKLQQQYEQKQHAYFVIECYCCEKKKKKKKKKKR
ncbi:hypothetical protein QR685DRAFT_442109, partial [Neurospora intermedia]